MCIVYSLFLFHILHVSLFIYIFFVAVFLFRVSFFFAETHMCIMYHVSYMFCNLSWIMLDQTGMVHPVPVTIFLLTQLFPRLGLPRSLFLIGRLTAALRFSKGWIRKDLNLVMGIGCTKSAQFLLAGVWV